MRIVELTRRVYYWEDISRKDGRRFTMLVAMAQMNAVIGDFDANRRRIVEFAEAAAGSGASQVLRRGCLGRADLVVFPELALCGYPPLDLLDQEAFVEAGLAALRRLQRELPPGIAVALGCVDRNRSGRGRPLVNSIVVIEGGKIVFSQSKSLLPTYDVFDEARYFEPATERHVFECRGRRIGFAICEDIWWEEPAVPGLRYPVDPVKELLDEGADLLVVPSASPFHAGKLDHRIRLSANAAREGGVPIAYCNLVGANDSLVFDGRSFALDAQGKVVASAGWEEELLVVDLGGAAETPPAGERLAKGQPAIEERWLEIEKALILGLRDYMRKCRFSKACLGLSGGIDSSLVAYLAAEAIGAENVVCLSLPSRFSSPGSVSDATALCENLGMRLESLPIEGVFSAYLDLLEPKFEGRPFDLTEENLQARIRGGILMAWSNKFGSLLLTTGNKSELATGYCTLYGDMCGALAVIGDLLKTEVFALCRAINTRALAEGRKAPIPESTISKPPSAELRQNQTDQDSLPPYDLLDAILELHIVENLGAAEIVARGFDASLVERILVMVARSEYKRRQAAPVIKISPRAFGMGRRLPIARGIPEAHIYE